MMKERYPRLEINLASLKNNVARVVEMCGSYGIQVAKLAGLPDSVIDRAKEIVNEFETDHAYVTVSTKASLV